MTGSAASSTGPVSETDAPAFLDARLTLTRGAFTVNVALSLQPGEVLALLGPNGSGKSTVLELLAGLLSPDAGTVLLDGVVLTRGAGSAGMGMGMGAPDTPSTPATPATPSAARAGRARVGGRVLVAPEHRGIGLLGQDALLFPHLSARANVEFAIRVGAASAQGAASVQREGLDGDHAAGAPHSGERYSDYRRAGRNGARSRADIRAEAENWLARVGLAGRGDATPAELSGGQQQRVALARALAARPRVLLLDEPLAALDAETAPAMRQLIREQLAATATTAILVTHDIVDAVVLADRVVVLQGGAIVDSGSTAAVLEAPRNPFVAALAGVNLVVGTVQVSVVQGGAVQSGAVQGGAVVAPDGRIFRPRPTDAAALTARIFPPPDSRPALADPVGAAPNEVAAAVVFRPAAVVVQTERPQHASPRNVWPATVTGIEPGSGGVRVRTSGNPEVIAELTAASVAELGLQIGTAVWLSVKATEVSAYRR